MGNGVSKCEWRHAPEARGRFGEFWRKLVELRTGHRTRRVDFRLLVEALGRCRTRWRGRWKSQNRNNVYLPPYVEKPLNSKVIKSFVPELRSRYMFFEFRDSYVLSLWAFDVRFTHSHIMVMLHDAIRTNYIKVKIDNTLWNRSVDYVGIETKVLIT